MMSQLPAAEARDLAKSANEFISGAHEFLEQTRYEINGGDSQEGLDERP